MPKWHMRPTEQRISMACFPNAILTAFSHVPITRRVLDSRPLAFLAWVASWLSSILIILAWWCLNPLDYVSPFPSLRFQWQLDFYRAGLKPLRQVPTWRNSSPIDHSSTWQKPKALAGLAIGWGRGAGGGWGLKFTHVYSQLQGTATGKDEAKLCV